MAVQMPPSDLSRAKVHDPDEGFPDSVELRVVWNGVEGPRERTLQISADQFFGRGTFGAPMSGDWLISAVERMRREGPPEIPTKRKPRKG